MVISDAEIKADVMNRLIRKSCWGAKYLPLSTIVNWLGRHIMNNGKSQDMYRGTGQRRIFTVS
ncbi:MAG: hypothetical protein QW304_04890 [Thermoproteota archaeon]